MSSILSRLTGDASHENAPITLDGVLYILKSDRRRHVLDLVADRGEITKRELVDTLLSEGVSRQSVYVSLHQQHLPRFVDFEVLDEPEPNTYAPGPAFEVVYDQLEAVREGMQ